MVSAPRCAGRSHSVDASKGRLPTGRTGTLDTVTSTGDIRVFLVDDHEVIRRGLTEMLTAVPGFDVVGEAATAAQAITRITAVRPDVAVIDGRLPDGSGIDVCREVRSAVPETYCMILTSFDDNDAVLASVLAGASGYVLKDVRAEALVEDIRQVAQGRVLLSPQTIKAVIQRAQRPAPGADTSALSPREREVLELIGDGLTNRQIATQLYLSEKTVKNHVSSILRKTGLERRTQAAVYASELHDQQ